MQVVLRPWAWASIVASCLEVYRKEGFGVLVGEVAKERLTVYSSIPFQTAQRKFVSTEIRGAKMSLIQAAIDSQCKMKILGCWHSHTDSYRNPAVLAPSIVDIAMLRGEARGQISLIVTVSGSQEKGFELSWGAWRINRRGGLCWVPGEVA